MFYEPSIVHIKIVNVLRLYRPQILNNFFEIGKNILHLAPIGATDFAQILWVAHSFI